MTPIMPFGWGGRPPPDGKRSRIDALVIPPDADGDEMTDLLDVAFHEMARPGEKVVRIS